MSDLLVDIPENPIPEGTRAGLLKMRDGCRIRYAVVPARDDAARGTVLILPGRNEFIEKYLETASNLAQQGFASAIIDWRGQGGSDRLLRDPDRGYIEHFSDYVDDLDQFFKEVVLPDFRTPFFILAHSMGALIALLAAPLFSNRVRRMVLCTPLLALPVSEAANRFVRILAKSLYNIGLSQIYMPGRSHQGKTPPFAGNKVTTDAARYARNQSIIRQRHSLAINGPTVAWTRAMFLAAEAVCDPAFTAEIRIPTLFLAAGGDTVVSTPAIERYTRRLRSASLLTVDGARHELLQEADLYREQVLAALNAFISGEGESLGLAV